MMDNPRVVYMLRMITPWSYPYENVVVGIFPNESKARAASKHLLKSPDFEGYKPHIDSWVIGHLYTKEVI